MLGFAVFWLKLALYVEYHVLGLPTILAVFLVCLVLFAGPAAAKKQEARIDFLPVAREDDIKSDSVM